MGNEHGKSSHSGDPALQGISAMDQKMQEKFSKGIQFNMKVIIRGERNTGKTSLFQRLQGGKFTDAYLPTDEIQVGTIFWGYKGTNDKVKVEIWDVVDKGRPKKQSSNVLKLFHKGQSTPEVSSTLDAEFLDVYKNTHGVIFVFDICKKWSWTYLEEQLPNVPYHIPVIVLGNFRDMGEHRTVSTDEPLAFIRHIDRPEGAAEIRYCETSMKNCFGLAYLHKFFSVPFLQMQQEMLLQQLQENRLQLQLTKEELEYRPESTDFSYSRFLSMVQEREEERRNAQGAAEQQAVVGKVKKQASVEKGTPALGRGEVALGHDSLGDSQDVLGDVDYSSDEEEEDAGDSGSDNNTDDDEPRGNPLVAGDEDIESEEEEPAVVSVPSLGPTHILRGGKSPAKGSNKLKSIKDVQLTDSESDNDQAVSGSVSAEQGNRPTKIKMSGEFSFDEPLVPSAAPLSAAIPEEPVRAKETGIGGGLLLSFASSSQQQPQPQQVVEVEEEAKKGKGKKRRKSKKVAEEEPAQVASETLDLDSWLGDDDQGAAMSTQDTAAAHKKKGTRKKSSKEGKRKGSSRPTVTDNPTDYELL